MASQATRSNVTHGPLGDFGLGIVAPGSIADAVRATDGCSAATAATGSAASSHGVVSPNEAPSTEAGESADLCIAPARALG
jgi:hypothetical protein